MIGIILVTHGRLGADLIDVAEYVVGKQACIKSVSFFPQDSLTEKEKEIEEALKEVSGEDGAVILTDMYGGSPANAALLFRSKKVEVLAGVNLPMLIKLIQKREASLSQAVSKSLKSGIKYIGKASKFKK